ncbi:hypothetical protein [Clostridium amylolyticum]|nr:hypothetical protein [Clostridium amylolyticum]
MCTAKPRQGGSTINKRIISKIKEFIDLICDRRVLFGIGIGILIGTFCMAGVKLEASVSNTKIEEKARNLGMKYPDEFKVFDKKDVGK